MSQTSEPSRRFQLSGTVHLHYHIMGHEETGQEYPLACAYPRCPVNTIVPIDVATALMQKATPQQKDRLEWQARCEGQLASLRLRADAEAGGETRPH